MLKITSVLARDALTCRRREACGIGRLRRKLIHVTSYRAVEYATLFKLSSFLRCEKEISNVGAPVSAMFSIAISVFPPLRSLGRLGSKYPFPELLHFPRAFHDLQNIRRCLVAITDMAHFNALITPSKLLYFHYLQERRPRPVIRRNWRSGLRMTI